MYLLNNDRRTYQDLFDKEGKYVKYEILEDSKEREGLGLSNLLYTALSLGRVA